jgi:hypothetical protein
MNYQVQFIKQFLGPFAKLQRATISFIMYVRLSVHMERFGSHWKIFRKIWYFSSFQKSVEKIHVSSKSESVEKIHDFSKSDKNKEYFI